VQVDDIDRKILALLAEDGRLSMAEVAARANVSRATAYSRYERLRRSGVITGVHASIDPRSVGLDVTALLLVNVDQGRWPEARDAVLALPGVEYVALTSGSFDFVLLVRVPDMATLRDVLLVRLHGLPHVRSTQTVFVLDEVRTPSSP
jgi:DNA-binding Lrp family transcriptional regulator